MGRTSAFLAALIVVNVGVALGQTRPASRLAVSRPTTVEVTIDFDHVGEPFDGWGTSLAWWAHRVGEWPDATLDRLVEDVVDPASGLGLSVFRYNIGGGDDPAHHHMRPGADVPGFKASATAPYDWNADAGQRRVLLKLIAATETRAATRPIVEAFSNSPPYWLTISGCAAGNVEGKPNLRESDERAFVDYLADVAQHYRDAHGVTFHSFQTMNEPDANWWKLNNRQEGCGIPPAQQARLVTLSRAALDARDLTETLVSANDANSLDKATAAIASYDADAIAALGQINAHSYHGRRRDELRTLAAKLGKPLWQSETGPLSLKGSSFEQTLTVAGRLIEDMNQLRPRVWCMWQAADNPTWGAFTDKDGTYQRNRTFDALAIFTRAIRPGDRLVLREGDDVLASVGAKGRCVFVVNRDDVAKRYLIRADAKQPATVTRVTETDGLTHVEASLLPRDGVYALNVPPKTIARLSIPR